MPFTRTLVAALIAAVALPLAPVVGDEPPPAAQPPAAAPPAAAPPTAAPAAAAPAAPPSNVFSSEQLDQIVAPVALYPDSLLMQILMASTYPLEVIEAERWTKKNPDLKGDELDKALTDKDWDPSVKSLTHFPTVLARMSDNLDWTKDMGDAFLGQQKDVLDAIQRMRGKAYELGNLKSTPEQNVIVEPAPAKAEGQTVVVEQAPPQIIKIEPAQPQVVYVPTYSSTVIYGPPPPTVYYPAVYAYPPGYVATASLLSFGAGMAVGAALWGGCNWHSGDVNVNYNYNYNRNTNVGNINKPEHWRHNPEHRKGVNYRNDAVAKKYGQPSAANRAARENARGYQRQASAQTRPASTSTGRQATRAGQQPRKGQPPRASQRASANRPAGTSRPAATSRDTAFGSRDSGRAQRNASARGAASRGVDRGSFASGRGGSGGGGRSGGFGGRGGGGRGGGGRRR
jgi:hypothetical protein